MIEARPDYAIVRLEGMHVSYTVPWDAIRDLGAKMFHAAEVREKKAKKGAK